MILHRYIYKYQTISTYSICKHFTRLCDKPALNVRIPQSVEADNIFYRIPSPECFSDHNSIDILFLR